MIVREQKLAERYAAHGWSVHRKQWGRTAVRLERFNLPNPGGGVLYEPEPASFRGHGPGRKPAPDETTVCKFRHLLERHGFDAQMFDHVNGYLGMLGTAPAANLLNEAFSRIRL